MYLGDLLNVSYNSPVVVFENGLKNSVVNPDKMIYDSRASSDVPFDLIGKLVLKVEPKDNVLFVTVE